MLRFLSRSVLVGAFLALGSGLAAAAHTKAFVVTTDFATGGLSVIDLVTRTVTRDVASVHSDAVLRWFGGLIYVVNRLGADNIQVIDPAANYATIRQFSVGNSTNPQDICLVSPTKAYVTRLASSDLLVVDPSSPNGGPMTSISLASFADSDGLPEMARMILVGRWLFVACQRLDSTFQPTNPAMVVVVDTQTNTVIDVDPTVAGTQGIVLAARNPTTVFLYDRAGARLLIGNAGAFGALDGGIEAIDPFTFQSLGIVTAESALGGDVLDLAWFHSTRSFAIAADASFNTSAVAWNPVSGGSLGTIYNPGGFSLADLDANDRNELYVCNNGFSTPGVLIFNATTGALLAGPLFTGLPPFELTFDETDNVVTGVEAEPGRGPPALSAPWPNPARTSVRLSLRLPAPSAVDAAVLDAAGRVVRRLLHDVETGTSREIEWDLRDREGARVPAGIYMILAKVDGRSSSRRVIVIR